VEEKMPGIPPDLNNRIQAVLLECGPFDSDRDIRAVFVDNRLSPWRQSLPQAGNLAARVQAVVEYLHDRYNAAGDNALVLLLCVLSERIDPGDACHQRLAGLAAELERELGSPDSPVTKEPATQVFSEDRQSDSYSHYETGLRHLLDRLKEHPSHYQQALVYEQRLTENINRSRRYGDNDASKRERAEIVDQLNQLSLSALSLPFNELCIQTPLGPRQGPLESPYGTMPPTSRFYIEREADDVCWGYLSQGQAVTAYVQAPRQVGKSSLMRRIAYRAKQAHGIDTVFIDFEKFTEAQFEDEEEFLVEFCCMMGDALGVPEAIDEYWSSRRRSNIVKCSNYVSQHIIPTFDQPFILALDEVERLLDKLLRNDFFGMLRTWHNDRAWDKNFARMTLLLSSSTEPHLFIDNLNQSPFNVTEPIALHDFTQAEVEELNRRHGEPLNQAQIGDLMELLGGHPFLTRLALYLLAIHRLEFEELLETVTSDTGPFADHLRRYWQHILDMPKVKQALTQICRHQMRPEDKLYYRLKGAGLVKTEDSQVVMRNQLYERYFKERLCG
jgi:hypothetical protein